MSDLGSRITQVILIIFDFDGVFTDNNVYVFEDGREAVRCSRADGIGLKKIKELNIKLLVLSTETNPVVEARCHKLKIECIQGVKDKKTVLGKYINDQNINYDQVAYIGNDINDLECIENVGLPVAVADAYPEILEKSKLILKRKGGEGAVREFCDLLYKELKSIE